MGFTDNQDLETQVSGQADWDTGLEGNFAILDRGLHYKLSAAEPINTGDIISVSSGALAWQYDANSLDLKFPEAISYKAVASGETVGFLRTGVINSIDSWSGDLIPGEPFFVSSVAGVVVSSYPGAAYSGGVALSNTSLLFNPVHNVHKERITKTSSLGLLAVDSAHFLSFDIGHAGLLATIEIISASHDNWDLDLYSGSESVTSENLYSSGTISSIYFKNKTPVPYRNTDVASPGLTFGTLTVNSSVTGVGSAHINVIFDAYRER